MKIIEKDGLISLECSGSEACEIAIGLACSVAENQAIDKGKVREMSTQLSAATARDIRRLETAVDALRDGKAPRCLAEHDGVRCTKDAGHKLAHSS